ncbi:MULTISPECIES: hypothetical protein [unclassified Sphingopyxis]|uniref:hypothetical protein n=1 Tax=unclassified Sphingopyxis TaxID=2614943 RepID=UPI000B1993DD|nr:MULTISPECIES: hypothetical protein [unclassified Sphingopyxis]
MLQDVTEFNEIEISSDLIVIDTQDFEIIAQQEGIYLSIRCRVVSPVRAAVNFGRTGTIAWKKQADETYSPIGKIKGEREGGQLMVAVDLKPEFGIVTILAKVTSELKSMQLRSRNQYDPIIVGSPKDEIIAIPRTKDGQKSGIRGINRTSSNGDVYIDLYIADDDIPVISSVNTGADFCAIPDDYASNSNSYFKHDIPEGTMIRLVGRNSGTDAAELGMTVVPLAF